MDREREREGESLINLWQFIDTTNQNVKVGRAKPKNKGSSSSSALQVRPQENACRPLHFIASQLIFLSLLMYFSGREGAESS